MQGCEIQCFGCEIQKEESSNPSQITTFFSNAYLLSNLFLLGSIFLTYASIQIFPKTISLLQNIVISLFVFIDTISLKQKGCNLYRPHPTKHYKIASYNSVHKDII